MSPTEKIKREPKVAIIIANYNGEKYLNECINSIRLCDYLNYKIIVVDDCSTDNSVKLLKREYADVITIESKSNKGFAHSNNVGIRFAMKIKAEYYLLLNNDTVVSKDFIIEMINNTNDTTISVPYIFEFRRRQTLQSAGGLIDWNCGNSRGIGEGITLTKKDVNTPQKISFASGCCMLLHKNIVDKIGFLREDYFMYFEDTEYSVRAIERGINIQVVPTSRIYHKHSTSMGGFKNPKTQYYLIRNRLFFVKDHRNLFADRVYTEILKDIFDLAFQNNLRMKKYLFMAIVDFSFGKRGKRKLK